MCRVTVDALHNGSVMRAKSTRISNVLLALYASSLECTKLPSHAVVACGGDNVWEKEVGINAK
jgi:hypothetical protein